MLTIGSELIHQTSQEIIDEFAALLKEFNLKIPDDSSLDTSSDEPITREAYEVLNDSIRQKIQNFYDNIRC